MPQGTPIVSLVYPVGGLNRQAAFQTQPPYTTPFALNVRSYDPLLTRQRGGSRPGLSKAFASAIGSGNPVQLLDAATLVTGPAITSNILLSIANGTLYYSGSGTMNSVGGWSAAQTTTPIQGAQVGPYYYIADYRPWASGLPVGLSASDGTIGSGTLTSAATNFQTALVTTSDVIYIAHSAAWVLAHNPKTYSTGTVTVGGGIATGSGTTWTAAMNGGSIIVSTQESMTILSVTSTTTMIVSDPTATFGPGDSYQIEYSYDSEEGIFPITGVSSGVISFTSSPAMTTGDTAALWQIGRWPQRFDPNAIAIANLNTPTTASPVAYGVPPLGCTLCCEYRGRLVLAGPGSAWYMSHVNDPTNWYYGAVAFGDVQGAVNGSSSPSGGLGPPLTALMPHSDQYLVMASLDSLSILNGDPGSGGQFQTLSTTIGCVGATAWCGMPDGSIMFLSRDGLYSIPSGGGYPVPVSRSMLPAELLDSAVDPVNNWISLAYDVFWRGVHIAVTPTAGGAGVYYFFDVASGAFWPEQYPTAMQPTTLLHYDPMTAGNPTQFLHGGMDGYIRQEDASATTDDGQAITSYVAYGPLQVGGAGYEGQIVSLSVDLDASSSNVGWGAFADNTAQAVVADLIGTPLAGGTFSAGHNTICYPRMRGVAQVILLTGTVPWAIEGMRITTRQGGRLR